MKSEERNREILDTLEWLKGRKDEKKADVGDIETGIAVNISENEDKAKDVIHSYTEIDGETEDKNSEITKVDVEQFKQDSGIEEQFSIPDEAEKKREIAHEFTPWLVGEKDVRACLIDREANIYEIWSFDEETKTWKPDGKQELKQVAQRQLGKEYSKNLRKEIEERLEGYKVIDYEETKTPEGTIPVQNGILDLETEELREIEKEDFITNKLPVEFQPEAEPPERFLQFLEESVNSENEIKKLQEFAGYTLMEHTCKYEKALMLLGPTDSGKSVFLDIMRSILGKENVAEESLQSITNTRWGVASLKNKTANIYHDLDPKQLENLGRIKCVTSGNEMRAEKKRQRKFTIEPKAKHLFSANQVPDTSKDDKAYYNRWLTVTFPESIPEEQQDRDLTEKLTQEEHLQGILNWCIEGMKRLNKQDGFTQDLDVLATQDLWDEWGNSVQRFISRYLKLERNIEDEEEREEANYKVHTEQLYRVYQKFANTEGFEQASKQELTRELKKIPGVRKGEPSIGGRQRRGFFKVELVNEASKQVDSLQKPGVYEE